AKPLPRRRGAPEPAAAGSPNEASTTSSVSAAIGVAAVVWPAASAQSEALLQEAAKHAAEFGRAEVDTEHLL
ncbi:hypothetical protein RFZ44_08000, partial [Acinetobacter sp. 163]|nr:hypothetical protein [Acinetobacter sp. 163]